MYGAAKMIDTCIYALETLRSVVVENNGEGAHALKGRAYARQKLSTISVALRELSEKKYTTKNLDDTLMSWIQFMQVPADLELQEPLNSQATYATECARICLNEMQLATNPLLREALLNVGSTVEQFSRWLTMYPPKE